MVYKIRNKSFFYTLYGWKNNYYNRVMCTPKDIKSEEIFCVKLRDDETTFIRMYNHYRWTN